MNRRATRYHIAVINRDGTAETIQANSRRPDAIKRARFVVGDTTGWPNVWLCYVIDTMACPRIAAHFNR